MKRDILIGDVHGCYDELIRLLETLDVTPDDRVISLGDLVDRGPDSVRAWQFFQDRPNSAVIMGNHERKHVNGTLSYSQQIVRLQFGDAYEAFRAQAATLPYVMETPDYIAVHGGFEAGVPLEEQRENVLSSTMSGARYLERKYDGEDWTSKLTGDKPVVFGHRVVGDEAQWYGTRALGLDTGACHGKYLTAVVVPGFTLHRVKAERDYWAEERVRWQAPVWESMAWGSYRWNKLERERGPVRRARTPEAQQFRERFDGWLQGLDALIPAVQEAAEARVTALATQAEGKDLKRLIAAEPAAAVLFASHAGTLDEPSLRSHLPTPDALVAAAQSFGLWVPTL